MTAVDLPNDIVLADTATKLGERARAALHEPEAELHVVYELRYRGQSFELAVEAPPAVAPEVLRERFAKAHEARYGYRDEAAAVELVNVRVSAWGPAPQLHVRARTCAEAPVAASHELVLDGRPVAATVLRGELPSGTRLEGPALCALPHSSLLVPPGWSLEVDAHGSCRLELVR